MRSVNQLARTQGIDCDRTIILVGIYGECDGFQFCAVSTSGPITEHERDFIPENIGKEDIF
jgi:hypothetical protein